MPSISGGAGAPHCLDYDNENMSCSNRTFCRLQLTEGFETAATFPHYHDDDEFTLREDDQDYECQEPAALWLNDDEQDRQLLLTTLLCENHRVTTNEGVKKEVQVGGGDGSKGEKERKEEGKKENGEENKKWSEGPMAKIMNRLGAQRLGSAINTKKRASFQARHSRGTAMHAPANKFWIIHREKKAMAHLLHVAQQGLGWYRTHPRPETLDELLRESTDTDLTGDLLKRLRKVAAKQAVSLETMLLKGSTMPLSHITALQRGKVSAEVVKQFTWCLQRDLHDSKSPDILYPQSVPTSGFAKDRLGTKIDASQERSTRVLLIPVQLGTEWVTVRVNSLRSKITVVAREGQDSQKILAVIREWSRRVFKKCGAPEVVLELRQGNLLAWILSAMFLDDTTPEQSAVDTFVAQTILRESCGWSEPVKESPPPSPEVVPVVPPPVLRAAPLAPLTAEQARAEEVTDLLGSTITDLLDRGWSWDSIFDSLGHMTEASEIRKWKSEVQLEEFTATEPDLDWNRKEDVVHDGATLKDLSVVIQNMGSRGMRKGWDQVREVMATNPGVAMFQEIKTPRHKLPSLLKLVERDLPNYTLFTNIAAGKGCKGAPHGVATLIRNDYMSGAKVIPIDEKYDRKVSGRVLSIQIAGAGAKSPIQLINVYNAVNIKKNLDLIANVLRVVQDMRNRAAAHHIPTVAAGDWNAALSQSQRFNYKGKEWEQGDALFQRFIKKCKWKVQSPSEGVQPTWFSHAGNQEAVLDHVLSFPSFLRIGKVKGKRLPDSRFDHSTLTVVIDGRDAGFETVLDEEKIHFPRMILNQWETMSYLVHDKYHIDTVGKVFDTDPWVKLKEKLKIYKLAAEELLGLTKQSTGRRPFHHKGHKQLHREVMELRKVKKAVHTTAVGDRFTPSEREECCKIRDGIVRILTQTKLTKATPLDTLTKRQVTKAAILKELDALILERVSLIDAEVKVAQDANIKQAVERLRVAFDTPGTKAIRGLLGKMGVRHKLWGLSTDYPSTVKVMSREGTVSRQAVEGLLDGIAVHATAGVDSVQVDCDHLIDLGEVLCRLSKDHKLEILPRRERIVTTASDKLCAEERFFASNAMSKQDLCPHCGSASIQSVTRKIEEKRQWGTWCSACQQWARPSNLPRSFKNDDYAAQVFQGFRRIPQNASLTVRGKIDLEDLVALLRRLPSHKASGDDGVPNELLRQAPEELANDLLDAVNHVLTGGVMPSEWKTGVIKLLEKKQPACLLRNQRPVCCARTVYKVVSHIINSRLVRLMSKYNIIEEDQEGGQRKKSCRRQVQKIVHVFEDAKRTQRQLYCVFVDWRNAYNGIDQDVIWEVLKQMGVQSKDVDLIASLYEESEVFVRNSFGDTASIPLKCGVKQGDNISPTLFTVVINVLLRQLNASGAGYVHSNGDHIAATAFVDDTLLLSDQATHCQRLIDEVARFAKWSNMEVAIEKTQVCAYDFRLNEEIVTHSLRYRGKVGDNLQSLHFNGSPLPRLSPHQPYKYLGVRITITLNWKFEKASILERITEATEFLRDTAYTYKQLDRVVRTCIVPVFRYSAAIVPWTKSELEGITALFNRAMRKAWKLPRSFSGTILQAPVNKGGLGTPNAETLQFQEMWGLYEQSFAHDDSVQRLMRWEFEDAKTRRGCATLQQVASDAYSKKGTTFVERLAGTLYGMGFNLHSPGDATGGSETREHSIVGVFQNWRSETVQTLKTMDSASWREWIRGLPGATESDDRAVSLKWAERKTLETKLRETNRVIAILARAKILSFDKLIATKKGDWISYFQLKRSTVGLDQESYEVFLSVLGDLVAPSTRVAIGTGVTQLSLLSFYSRITRTELLSPKPIERDVPEPFQHLVEQFSPSGEGRSLRRRMVSALQGEHPPPPARRNRRKQKRVVYDSDDEHDPHLLIQNISKVIDERIVEGQLQLRCTFHTVDDPPTDKKVREVQRSTVIRALIRHQAHVTVPSGEAFWYTPGDGQDITRESLYGDWAHQTLRIQGQRSNGDLDCVIVDGPKVEDIGAETSIAYAGQFGLRSMIKDLSLAAVCRRGSEWVPGEAFGVTDDNTTLIHPVVWEHLVGNGMSSLFEAKAPRCERCGQSVVSDKCVRLCAGAKWKGEASAAQGLPSKLCQGDKVKEKELWELKASKLVSFDLSSSNIQVVRRDGRLSVQQRSGKITVVSQEALDSGTAPLSVHAPLFRVMEARNPLSSYSDLHQQLERAALVDVNHRHLSIPFLTQLAAVDSTEVAIGVDPVTSGPVFSTILDHETLSIDTDLSCYPSVILNLVHLSLACQRTMIEVARKAAQKGTRITILQQSAHQRTPEQLVIENNLKVWATQASRITSRTAIWQPKNSWKGSRPKPSCWKGVTVWVAGPRGDRVDKVVRVLKLKTTMQSSTLVDAYINAVQGTQYAGSADLLAATDGSVKTDDDGDSLMGGGYCFSEGGPASKCFQVGGEAASLRAEAAAMWQVLVAARTMPTRSLVVLCDSLGLLQILQGFRRRDYQYHPDSSAHFDIIRLILEELNSRVASVKLVKVKSHVGIELNERADVLANAGLTSDDVVCCTPAHTWPLWVSASGGGGKLTKAALFKDFRERYHEHKLKVAAVTAGITTQHFLESGLCQKYCAKANKALALGNQRLWLLSKGDSYPTRYHRYRTGQATDDECTLPGCTKRETYDHSVCSCKVISSAARAVHDRVWRGVFDIIKAGVPVGVRAIYDTAIGRIPGMLSNKKISRLQPDGIVIRGDYSSIELLEFTRTGDLWPGSLTGARDRKADKYIMLQDELQLLYPAASVTVIPFVVGARSYINESHWSSSWDKLQLSQASLVKILPKIQAWNVEGAREVLGVRAAIRKGEG